RRLVERSRQLADGVLEALELAIGVAEQRLVCARRRRARGGAGGSGDGLARSAQIGNAALDAGCGVYQSFGLDLERAHQPCWSLRSARRAEAPVSASVGTRNVDMVGPGGGTQANIDVFAVSVSA